MRIVNSRQEPIAQGTPLRNATAVLEWTQDGNRFTLAGSYEACLAAYERMIDGGGEYDGAFLIIIYSPIYEPLKENEYAAK